jgi:hypothetical protein
LNDLQQWEGEGGALEGAAALERFARASLRQLLARAKENTPRLVTDAQRLGREITGSTSELERLRFR